MAKPKIAIIDLLLHYPPHGGACVDLFHTFTRLVAWYEIKLFGVHWNPAFPRGQFDAPPPLPADIEVLTRPSREAVVDSFLRRIQRYRPDLVFLADGWMLKPYIAQAVKQYWPTVVRFYAYEGLCPRTNERWRYDAEHPSLPCDAWALDDTTRCLACANEYRQLVLRHKKGQTNMLIDEMETAEIWRGDYADALRDTLAVDALIVYNTMLQTYLRSRTATPVHVVPGGVDPELFTPAKAQEIRGHERECREFVAFVPGRMDSASKGGATAVEAGRLLQTHGRRIRMGITRRPVLQLPWLDELGWLYRDAMRAHLARCDAVIAPSLWQEAFGMTWVEAMAMRKPVIAGNVAGPADWIEHGRNGLLFTAGCAEALADNMAVLMDDPALWDNLAAAGHRLVLEKLTWDRVVARIKIVLDQVLR